MSSQALIANEVGSAASSIPTQSWRWWHTISVIVFIIGVVTIGPLLPPTQRLLIWLGYLALLFFFILILGHGITGKLRGVLIDDRNKMSLSRLQNLLWTVVVLSAFLAAAITNINFVGSLTGLKITLPEQLWILMGISITSLIGTPLIQSTKQEKTPPPDQKVQTATSESKGMLIVNKSKDDAQWSDMFKGEEIANKNTLDLGKVQMFCFTILLVFAYAVALGALFSGSNNAISTFPPIDTSVVALLGISHAGYLVNKAIPRPLSSQ